MKLYHLLILIGVLLCVLPCSAEIASGQNVSAYGNVTGNYTATIGADQLNILVNVPLTMEDVAFPTDIFYFFAILGAASLLVGTAYTAKSDSVPSIAITACGLVAMGAFFIAAAMSPYVAAQTINQDIVCGATTNVIYITSINTYTLSSWVGWAMIGGGTAGFLMAILGGLSFVGYFHRKGIKDASKGKYLETDIADDQPGKY